MKTEIDFAIQKKYFYTGIIPIAFGIKMFNWESHHSIIMGLAIDHLQIIKQKFPQQSERIEELYRLNEDFRTLCSDYLLCRRELQKFHYEANEKKTSVEEYKAIQSELENELFHFIFPV